MINKPKALFIFFRPPYPYIGGDKIRMHQNLTLLSNKYNIDILFLNEKKTTNETIVNLKKLGQNIINFDISKKQFYFNTFLGLFNSKPLQVNYYYHKKVQRWIDNNIKNYDVVFCNTIRMAEYVKDKPVFKILDYVDAISMNYKKALKNSSFGLWKLMYYIDNKRLPHYERSLLKKFNKKIIISEVDKKHILKDFPVKEIEIIPNYVFFEDEKTETPSKDVFSFIGKMDYEPNVTAVINFCEKIFPLIKKENPKTQFNIIGYNPNSKVKELNKIKNVNVLGFVSNLDEKIKESKLIVAPMISGAGIQNKILQSLYLEKCVVTTGIGAEGLNKIKNEKEIFIVDDDLKMAEKINLLLKDKTICDKIGVNGKKYVENMFSKEFVTKKLHKYLFNQS